MRVRVFLLIVGCNSLGGALVARMFVVILIIYVIFV